MLTKAGHLSRALFLHRISMEECGKMELLGWWATGVLAGHKQDTRKLRRALANHKAKNSANAYMLALSEEEKNARQRKDWKSEREAFTRAKREFHEKSNRAKNAALYVDINDGKVTTPRDSITAEMVAEIAKQNERYLGLVQRNLKMILKWEKEPPGKEVRQLIERMEQLAKEMPDDPYTAVQVLMEEIAALAKRKEKEAEGQNQ
jgi:AbiV family abortive infection protein